jgi:hypothetical protein
VSLIDGPPKNANEPNGALVSATVVSAPLPVRI